MTTSFKIVLVEPEEKLREEVREVLRQDGYRVWAFARADHAAQAIAEGDTEPSLAILSGGEDPGVDRLLEVLTLKGSRCQRVWIAPAGRDQVDKLAVERRPRGLLSRTDLVKEARRLAERVWRTQERGRALVQVPAMLGQSAAMVVVRDLVDRIAQGGAPNVLITGETG